MPLTLPRSRRGSALVVLGMLVLVLAGTYPVAQANRAKDQRDTLATSTLDVCARGGPAAAELAARGQCRQAAEVVNSPAIPGARGSLVPPVTITALSPVPGVPVPVPGPITTVPGIAPPAQTVTPAPETVTAEPGTVTVTAQPPAPDTVTAEPETVTAPPSTATRTVTETVVVTAPPGSTEEPPPPVTTTEDPPVTTTEEPPPATATEEPPPVTTTIVPPPATTPTAAEVPVKPKGVLAWLFASGSH